MSSLEGVGMEIHRRLWNPQKASPTSFRVLTEKGLAKGVSGNDRQGADQEFGHQNPEAQGDSRTVEGSWR